MPEDPATQPSPQPPIAPSSAPRLPVTGAGEKVQSTATGELMQRLARAPKLDEARFALLGELGKGGMGLVVQIHDQFLNRRLAMKVLLERSAPRNEQEQRLTSQLLGRFLEEAQVTSQLDHPGVVPVHELGIDQNGKVYFTMRMVKGRTASEVFADAHAGRNDWTIPKALEVALKVCDTMSYAHDKGVLHRDLKPANVMVGRFGEVYVMDWGLAKVLGQHDRHDLRIRADDATGASRLETARKRDTDSAADNSVVSMDGQQLGTPSYMSPEQARSEELDARADVYSIGAMLYELLAGRAPYTSPGLRLDAYRILKEVNEGPPTPLHLLAKAAPAELIAIVDKAMARDREQRYPSTSALAADLRAYLGQHVVSAYKTGAIVELRLWIRRNKPLAASLAAAVLSLAAGAVGTSWLASANAGLARRQTELASDALRAKDQALAEKARADEAAAANARLAVEKGELADAEARAKATAERTIEQFHLLSGVVRLRNLVRAADALGAPTPATAPAFDAWLADADRLLAMRQDVVATIAALRGKALPATPEEREADRRTSPVMPALVQQRRIVATLERAQAIRAGTTSLVEPELTDEQRAASAKRLHELAWAKVAPPPDDDAGTTTAWQRTEPAEEELGLALARAAVARCAAGDPSVSACTAKETLAWALLANGQDQAAIAAADEALADVPVRAPSHREQHEASKKQMLAAIAEAGPRLAAARALVPQLAAKAEERRTWTFAPGAEGESQRFLHETLVLLRDGLDAVAAQQRVEVASRLAWARQVGVSAAHPKARVTWAAARASLAKADGVSASSAYAGKGIVVPENGWSGLVPIGMNPATKLWEFYDLRSAWDGASPAAALEIPEHEPDGGIQATDALGIVFALIPGGAGTFGSQKSDPSAAHYDLDATDSETLRRLELSPYLIARHEMTQAQWERLRTWDTGEPKPSRYRAGSSYRGIRFTAQHPVESVTWIEAERLVTRYGMMLPTEAQWEFACRFGSTTPWSVPLADLPKFANVSDLNARRASMQWDSDGWRDRHLFHAPVGSYAPNGFGLFDMHGNVWEWCRDGYGYYGDERPGDGLRVIEAPPYRVARSGSYMNKANAARSANCNGLPATYRNENVGLRAARDIGP